MLDCRYRNAVDCAGRAADHTSAIIHQGLERGVVSLKAIACISPLLGMFGTTIGLIHWYAAMSAFDRGETAGGPAEAFVLIALSLPIAVVACAGFHYLKYQAETFDLEMRAETLDLLNDLARRPRG
jgi:biopolymer transport protein ExbB/TolQ